MIAYECTSDVLETKQIIKFSIKDYFSKCEQIRSFLRFWSHLLKKPVMENLIFLQSEIHFKRTTNIWIFL